MPITEISILLNNCALHALIPQLMSQIRKVKDNDEFPVEMRAFEAQYELLKTLFADFYRFDVKNFGWQDFREHLPNNNLDLQIILGPVLRQFMAKIMPVSLYFNSNSLSAEAYAYDCNEVIKELTAIQSDGRYASLDAANMFYGVAEPLGFKMILKKDGHEIDRYPKDDDYLDKPEFLNNPQVTLVHEGGDGAAEGGHFQLETDEAVTVDESEDSKLEKLAALFTYGTQQFSEDGLEILRAYVLAAKDSEQLEEWQSQLDAYLDSIGSVLFDVSPLDPTKDLTRTDGSQTPPNYEFCDLHSSPQHIREGENPLKSKNCSIRSHTPPRSSQTKVQSPPDYEFWTPLIYSCIVISSISAVIAILTCPPLAAALGVSSILGVAVADVSVTAAFICGSSLLLSASFFAIQATNYPVTQAPLSSVGPTV